MLQKKGELSDSLILLVTLFVGVFVFLALGIAIPKVAIALNQTGLNINNQTQAGIDELYSMGTTGINQGFIILFGGLVLVQFASAFLVRQHPFFMLLYFIMLLLTAFVGIYLGNTFEDIQTNPTFAEVLQEQTVANWVMENILIIIIVVDLVTLFLLFAKVGSAEI